MDGTNGLTECPIVPGGTKVYRFKATQYGTSVSFKICDDFRLTSNDRSGIIRTTQSSMETVLSAQSLFMAPQQATMILTLEFCPLLIGSTQQPSRSTLQLSMQRDHQQLTICS